MSKVQKNRDNVGTWRMAGVCEEKQAGGMGDPASGQKDL